MIGPFPGPCRDNRKMPPHQHAPAPSLPSYHALTPDVVLDALDNVGLRGDGRLMTLNSYENRVYQAHLEDGAVVVLKFYRPHRWTDAQIQEEHGFAWDLADHEVPAVAPLRLNGQTLHHHAGFGFSVSPRRGGRRPELDDPEVLEWVGRFLGRIHSVGAVAPFQHRPPLNAETLGQDALNWLTEHPTVPPEVRPGWQEAAAQALSLARTQLEDMNAVTLRLHGDCHPGNILWTPTDRPLGGPHFVDLDDARCGPAVQDLWMLLSGDRLQQQRQLGALLDGYEQFRDFDRRELGLIEALRTLRLLHYSAWLARRWHDPTFPIHFPWFGTSSYWLEQTQMLWDQLEAMRAPALVA
jgi:Ser/Thr protein kinase RdoA (MazF antagonist)